MIFKVLLSEKREKEKRRIISARPQQGVVLNFGLSILWNLAEPLHSKQSIQKNGRKKNKKQSKESQKKTFKKISKKHKKSQEK